METAPPEITTKNTARHKDLTGQRFGKLVVLSPTEKRMDNGSIVWRCQCDCGNTAEVSARRLTRGKVRSCGCLSDPPPKDSIGKVFGRLTVTGYAGRKRKKTDHSAATITYFKVNGRRLCFLPGNPGSRNWRETARRISDRTGNRRRRKMEKPAGRMPVFEGIEAPLKHRNVGSSLCVTSKRG